MKWKIDCSECEIQVLGDSTSFKVIGICDESNAEICMIDTETQMIDDEWKKNANLIAAAPDLLEALHDIVENSGDIVAVSVAKTAIQKAEGK